MGIPGTNLIMDPTTDNHIFSNGDKNKLSLLSAMSNFVDAVNSMDQTVMVPCKLLDIHDDVNDKAVLPVSAESTSSDLYTKYIMLNAIRTELIRGHASESEDDEDGENEKNGQMSEADEQAKQLAKNFRHHLKGLFSVLHQLTESAQCLTKRYQDSLNNDLMKSTL